MDILQLPDELLARIAEHTISQQDHPNFVSPHLARLDVVSLTLTCKRFGRVARPLLFSSLQFNQRHKDTATQWYQQRNAHIFSTMRPITVKELVLRDVDSTHGTDLDDEEKGISVPLMQLLSHSSLSPIFALVLSNFDGYTAGRWFLSSLHRIKQIKLLKGSQFSYTARLFSRAGAFLKSTTPSTSLTIVDEIGFTQQALTDLWTYLDQNEAVRDLSLLITARAGGDIARPPFKRLTSLAISGRLLSIIAKSGVMESLPALRALEVCESFPAVGNNPDACSDGTLSSVLDLCPNLTSLKSPLGFDSMCSLPPSLINLNITYVLRGSTLSPGNLCWDIINDNLPELSKLDMNIDWERFYKSLQHWNVKAPPSEQWISVDTSDDDLEGEELSMQEERLQAYLYPYLEGFRETLCCILDDYGISYCITPFPIFMLSCKPPFRQLKITRYFKRRLRSTISTGSACKPILNSWCARQKEDITKLYELKGWTQAAPKATVVRKRQHDSLKYYEQAKLDTFLARAKA